MRIWTSYYSAMKNKAAALDAVTLVQVSNTRPDWFPYDIWVPDIKVCPSWEIINRFKRKEISYEQFTDMYLNELNGRTSPEGVLRELQSISDESGLNDLVLLCWEKAECHRFALARWVGGDYRGELR